MLCISCMANASRCEHCAPGLVVWQGNCLPACPPNTQTISGVCVTPARTLRDGGSDILLAGLVGTCLGLLVLLAAVVIFWRLARRKRIAVLSEALTTMQSQGLDAIISTHTLSLPSWSS